MRRPLGPLPIPPPPFPPSTACTPQFKSVLTSSLVTGAAFAAALAPAAVAGVGAAHLYLAPIEGVLAQQALLHAHLVIKGNKAIVLAGPIRPAQDLWQRGIVSESKGCWKGQEVVRPRGPPAEH